jgi:2-polyprenyl-6-methoxyphenol hydroxylase-like FAD-dependent oxidoreductase
VRQQEEITMFTRVDAVIVGARCAGAATALLLARAGAQVLVIDRAPYGSDTQSTHALLRGAVLQLHRWGLLPRIVAAGTPPVRRTSFSYSDRETTIDIEPRFGVDALYAPRRTVLDRVLVDAARAAGADIRFGTRLEAVPTSSSERTDGIRPWPTAWGRRTWWSGVTRPACCTATSTGSRSKATAGGSRQA